MLDWEAVDFPIHIFKISYEFIKTVYFMQRKIPIFLEQGRKEYKRKQFFILTHGWKYYYFCNLCLQTLWQLIAFDVWPFERYIYEIPKWSSCKWRSVRFSHKRIAYHCVPRNRNGNDDSVCSLASVQPTFGGIS